MIMFSFFLQLASVSAISSCHWLCEITLPVYQVRKKKNAAQPQPEHLTHKMKLTSSTSAVRTAASDRQHETLAVNFTRGSKHSSMQHSLTGTPSQYSEGHSGILGNVGNMKHFLGYTALRCIKKGTQHKQQSSEHLHPHIWVLPIKNTLQAHPKILKV